MTLNTAFKDSNGKDIGYPAPPTLTLNVPDAVPVVTSVQKGSSTASNFVISVSGYSTPRQNTSACFKFAPSQGSVLDTTGLNACYGQQDNAVYWVTPASVPNGSMFKSNITFSFAGDITAIGKVDTWLSNDVGTSNHYCLDFPSSTAVAGACQ